jgi:hypothetical protein
MLARCAAPRRAGTTTPLNPLPNPPPRAQVVADAGLRHVLSVSACPSGGLVVVAHSLALLAPHQQPLQQCMTLFSHLQSYLQGVSCARVCVRVCVCGGGGGGGNGARKCWNDGGGVQQLTTQLPAQDILCASCFCRRRHRAAPITPPNTPPAAVKCADVAHSEWASLQADFAKRFQTQLAQEVADQGSSITGAHGDRVRAVAAHECAVLRMQLHTCGSARKVWGPRMGCHTTKHNITRPALSPPQPLPLTTTTWQPRSRSCCCCSPPAAPRRRCHTSWPARSARLACGGWRAAWTRPRAACTRRCWSA